MKSDDLKKAPKLLAESITIGRTPEYFVLGVRSGAQAQAYSLTPQHAKRLLMYLDHEIKTYEEAYGTIDATWSPNVKSPLQRKNPPQEGS